MFVNFNILNQLGSPAINSNVFANRPAAGQTGRLFVSTDTFEIYRDNGTTWDLIGGPGSSTITGTGTATQVAYFTSSQAIGSSANLYWDNTAGALGINTATPGAELDVHGTGTVAQFNTTAATGNVFIALQRSGTGLWRIGDTYNSGSNYFELHNTTLANNAIQIAAATNKSILTSVETYSTGVARGNLLDFTLSLANGTTFTSPNTVTAFGATLNLNIAGSATIPAGARSGADFFNGINFTSAGTFTVNQSTTIRAFSNVTAGWAFNGSAVGTVTHLAGLRVLFPTNSGSAINVTDNYALLINNQNANTGTITYTNRWGIYQEGSSDLNYMAANLLLGSTVNTGDKLQVTGTTYLSGQLTVGNNTLYVDTVFSRVGVNTNTPSYTLDVIGSGGSFSADNNGQVISKQALDLATAGGRFTGQSNRGSLGAIHIEQTTTGADGGYIEFRTSSSGSTTPTAKMRLDASGNLGLGVTPSAWNLGKVIEVGGGANGGFIANLRGGGFLTLTQNAYYNGGYLYNENGYASLYYQQNGQHIWNNAPSGTAGNAISFTQAMTLDASGNLGLGVSPSAWNVSAKSFDINAGSLYAFSANIATGVNAFFDTAWRYKQNGFASLYNQDSGIHEWYNAPSGTAGNSITFTQAMTLKANGNLLIGTTTDSGARLSVKGGIIDFDGDTRYGISRIYNSSTGDMFGFEQVSAVQTGSNAATRLFTSATGSADLVLGKYTNATSFTSFLTLSNAGNALFAGSIKTAAPTTGTAAEWKLGSRVAAAVALDATQYIELDVGGTLYKLAIVT